MANATGMRSPARRGLYWWSIPIVMALGLIACTPTPPSVLAPDIVQFDAEPASIAPGDSSTLRWQVDGATSVVVTDDADAEVASASGDGEQVVSPAATTAYTLTATGPGGVSTATTTVTVGDGVAPDIVQFAAFPPTIAPGSSSTLRWQVDGATSVVVTDEADAEIATASGDGEQAVSPSVTTVYTLTATGPGGVSTATTTVTVDADVVPGAPQIVSFSATVVRDSQVQLAWTATDANEYDVYAVLDGNPSNAQLIVDNQVGGGATVAIPASDRQRLRLVARGDTEPADTLEIVLENVVVRGDDYDPYDIQGFTPEAEVPGTLRSVLANAAPGSVIGFASDITQVTLYGVDIEQLASVNQDAHLIFRDDVVVSGPTTRVTIEAISGWQPGDPGEAFTYRSRVAFVMPGTTVELNNLILTGGTFIFNGGGVRNDGNLTLDAVEVSGNRAWGRGGAIWNNTGGVLNVVDSVLTGNRAVTLAEEEGAVFAIRGGDEITVAGASGFGGAVYNNDGATVTFTNSVIDGNEARFSGGGIYNDGTVTLVGTDLTNNVADHNLYAVTGFSYGGGIYTEGVLDLTDGDLLDNTAASQGGGLYHDAAGVSNLDGVLIGGNLAGTSGEMGYGGGIMYKYFTGEMGVHLVLVDVVYGPNNVPQNILSNDEGVRPAGFSTLDAGPRPGRFYLPPGVDPDARNQ